MGYLSTFWDAQKCWRITRNDHINYKSTLVVRLYKICSYYCFFYCFHSECTKEVSCIVMRGGSTRCLSVGKFHKELNRLSVRRQIP